MKTFILPLATAINSGTYARTEILIPEKSQIIQEYCSYVDVL